MDFCGDSGIAGDWRLLDEGVADFARFGVGCKLEARWVGISTTRSGERARFLPALDRSIIVIGEIQQSKHTCNHWRSCGCCPRLTWISEKRRDSQ